MIADWLCVCGHKGDAHWFDDMRCSLCQCQDFTRIAMQSRCVACRMEQYGPAVWGISHGNAGCVWCGHTPEPLSEVQYRNRLKGVPVV